MGGDAATIPVHPHADPRRGRAASRPYPGAARSLYAELSDHDLFIAGAPGFVTACVAAADALGARRERIHTEVFFVEPQPWTREPLQAGEPT